MLSRHIFHQFGIGNPRPNLRLVIPWVVVSLLIDLGYSAVAIGDRLGHETIEITLRYYDKKNVMTS